MTTIEFIDAIRRRHDCSDYRAAQLLGVTRSTVSDYRRGKTLLSEGPAIRAAELLGLDPGYVLAEVAAERSSVPAAAAAWRAVAQRVAKLSTAAAILLFVTIGNFGAGSKVYAAFPTAAHFTPSVYYDK